MRNDPTDFDGMTPRELLESPRGAFLIAKAFHYAAQQLSRFPEERQPSNDIGDMLRILDGCFPELAAQFQENDRRWQAVHTPRAVALDPRRRDRPEEDADR